MLIRSHIYSNSVLESKNTFEEIIKTIKENSKPYF